MEWGGGIDERSLTFPERLFFFVFVFAVTFAVCYIWHRAFWPGSFSPDSVNQYRQALTGEYADWHPYLHTLLFFRLPMAFSDDPALIIMFQYTLFSLAVAYLLETACSFGIPRTAILLSWAVLLLNPNTSKIMIVPWKDGGMTIFALIMFTLLLRMFCAPEEWNRHLIYAFAFGIAAFLTNQMRHNAILLVGGVFLFVLLFYKKTRRKMLVSLAVFLVLTLAFKGPIYHLLHVQDPGGRNVEISGLPMTVLCDIYVTCPDNMDEDIRAFMETCGTQEEWDGYSKGAFNSIKWKSDTVEERVEEKGIVTIVEYAVRSAARNPATALQAVISLTRMVWQFDGGSGWTIGTSITSSANAYGIAYHDQNTSWAEILGDYASLVSNTALKYLFNYTGVMILVMLLAGVARIGRAGPGRAFLVLAPMAYDFGTMLLLSGSDFRFFHFNFVIVVPVILVLLFTDESLDKEATAQGADL